MISKSLGIRDAKINLSKVMKKVKEGQEVIITERGKPIGRIIPFSPKNFSLEERIRILEDQGLIDPVPKNSERRLPPPLPAPEGLAQKYLQEGRNRWQGRKNR
jgi:prevent-host-death family protein